MSDTGLSGLLSKINELFSTTAPSSINNILIIDAMNMFMRSYNVLNHIDADGDHVGGLSGFLKSVGSSIKHHYPTEVYIIFDGEQASRTKRLLYPAYKGNRQIQKISKPLLFENKDAERQAIYSQAVRCIGYCKLLPVKVLSIDNMEADDVIAVFARKLEADPTIDTVTIITEDADYLQLVNDKVRVYFPIKKQFGTEAYLQKKYECSSKNFPIFKALRGDKSDNIPGIKGLGDKTIVKLFPFITEDVQYTMDDVYEQCKANLSEHVMYTKVLGNKQQLDINYKLVNLHEIEFLDKDLQAIDDLIESKDLVFDPETFMRLYNSDGLVNSIINVRTWLDQCFKYLKK